MLRRTYIQQKYESFSTANKKDAVKFLEKYERLQFQKMSIQIHTKTFSECLKQFEKSLDAIFPEQVLH